MELRCMQERNKPIEPPKKPAQAPFFLPIVPGLARDPVFDVAAPEQEQKGAHSSYDRHGKTRG